MWACGVLSLLCCLRRYRPLPVLCWPTFVILSIVCRGFVAAVEDYCCSLSLQVFEFKRKRKIKKECSCLCLSCQHINRPEFYYTALLTTTVPVYHAFCSVWSLGLLTVWSQKKLISISTYTPLLLHVWSRLTIDLVPNCSAQTTQACETSTNAARSCPLKFIFISPTLQFQTRIVSTG